MIARRDPFLVLVTGHAGAGKSTLAPRIADAIDAVLISRDEIHFRVFDGWEPKHPASPERYDPVVDGNTFHEGKVNWSIFLWVIDQVVRKVPVVAETPFNHRWNREMFNAKRPDVPTVEVALHGSPDVLLERVRKRAATPDIHPIKARFSVPGAERLLKTPYEPILHPDSVLPVDTTDLDDVNIASIVAGIERVLASRPEEAEYTQK